jgi:hypothetical protein
MFTKLELILPIMKNSLLMVMIGLLTFGHVFSQQPGLEKSHFGGFVLRNNGIGLIYTNYRFQNSKFNRIVESEIVNHRHPKEVKIINTVARDPSPYVYGKLNKIAVLRLNVGINKALSEMDENGNTGLSFSITSGVAAAILKPVFLDIYHPSIKGDGIVLSERYNPENQINQQDIIGYSNSRFGWNLLTYSPAINLKTSLDIKWGNFSNSVKLIRIGTQIEFFPFGLKVMANTSNPKTYFYGFLAISIGSKAEY